MKTITEEKARIKGLLKANKDRMMELLYPHKKAGDYSPWGNTKDVVNFFNEVFGDIDEELFNCQEREECGDSMDDMVVIKYRGWKLDIYWVNNKHSLNLKYVNDDHTAWVVKNKKGEWIDFDIGGS